MKINLSILSLTLFVFLISCESTSNKQTSDSAESIFDYSGIVEEVIQTSNYTYCYVTNDKNEHWVAISRMDLHAGETLYFNKGMEMRDFHSKELDRTFPSIFFVQKASTDPTGGMDFSNIPKGDKPVKPTIEKKDYTIQKAADGITVAELFKNKEKYKGKKVIIRGKVTKFNDAIMSTNWAHIQDGSEYDGNFDLTVTTAEFVNENATVTFEGTVELDVDFGYGYFYPVLLQDAVVVHDVQYD